MSVATMTRGQLRNLLGGAAKVSKYRSKRAVGFDEVGNQIGFASVREAKRWSVLLLRWKADEITLPQRQVRYPLVVNKVKVCTYVADFVYHEKTPGKVAWPKVVEDVKGFRTDTYKLKAKLMRAVFGIEIKEV